MMTTRICTRTNMSMRMRTGMNMSTSTKWLWKHCLLVATETTGIGQQQPQRRAHQWASGNVNARNGLLHASSYNTYTPFRSFGSRSRLKHKLRQEIEEKEREAKTPKPKSKPTTTTSTEQPADKKPTPSEITESVDDRSPNSKKHSKVSHINSLLSTPAPHSSLDNQHAFPVKKRDFRSEKRSSDDEYSADEELDSDEDDDIENIEELKRISAETLEDYDNVENAPELEDHEAEAGMNAPSDGQLSTYQRRKIAARKFDELEYKLTADRSLLSTATLKQAAAAETPGQREQRLGELYQPNPNSSKSYNFAITACTVNGQWARALVLLSHMIPPSPLASTLVPSYASFIAGLRAATMRKDWEYCLHLFKHLVDYEHRLGKEWMAGKDDPTHIAEDDVDSQEFQEGSRANMYDLVCMAALRCEEYQLCEDIFARLQSENIEIFSSTYSTVLRSLTTNEKWQRIDELISSLPEGMLAQTEANVLEESLRALHESIQEIEKLRNAILQRSDSISEVLRYQTELVSLHNISMSISTNIYRHFVAAGVFTTFVFRSIPFSIHNDGLLGSSSFPKISDSLMRHKNLRHLPFSIRLSTAIPLPSVDGSIGGVSHFTALKNVAAAIQLFMRYCKHSYMWNGGKSIPQVLVIPPHSAILPLKEETILNAMHPPLYSVPKPFPSAAINACFIEMNMSDPEHSPIHTVPGTTEEELLNSLDVPQKKRVDYFPNSTKEKKLREVPSFKRQEETVVRSRVFGEAPIASELFGSVIHESSIMEWINSSLTWCERQQMSEIEKSRSE